MFFLALYKGEKDFEFIVLAYIEFMHVYALCLCFFCFTKWENVFESLNKKGEKVFGKKILDLCFVSHLIDAYMFV